MAIHIPRGEVTRTLGPFEHLHTARSAVIDVVGQVLLWDQTGTGGFVAEKYSPLWVVEVRSPSSGHRLHRLHSNTGGDTPLPVVIP